MQKKFDRKINGYKPPDLSVEKTEYFYHYLKPLTLDMESIQNPKSKIQNPKLNDLVKIKQKGAAISITQCFFARRLWLLSAMSILAVSPAWAKETLPQKLEVGKSNDSKLNQLVPHSPKLYAQATTSPVDAAIKITGVQLYKTDGGIEVVLKTSDAQSLKPTTTVTDNVAIANVPNAVLEIPNRPEYSFANPMPGITLVTVKNVEGGGVRVEVTGKDKLIKSTVGVQGQELTLAVSLDKGTQADSPAKQDIIQVTGVDIYETDDDGIEVVLTTTDAQLLIPNPTSTVDNTIITDIPKAQLKLPKRQEFQIKNPLAGIALVKVTNQDENSIRVEISGQDSPPKATIRKEGKEFVLAISPGVKENNQATQKPEEETIELVVTGREDQQYRVPESSVGTRTETPIINVPQAIQIVPRQAITEQGSTTVGETLRNTAGVLTGRASSESPALTPVIRGFESRNILRNGQQDVTLGTISGTPNVEQIEVLKGPASVLFGQGDPGGTVNVVTKKPLDEPFYKIDYQVGDFNFHRPSIDFTGPFDIKNPQKGGYRLTASFESADSFKNFEERRSFFISPVVKLINTDRTQLTAELEYNKFESFETAPELPARGTVVNNPNGEIDPSANLGEPSLSESETRATRLGYQFKHKFNDRWSISNEFLFSQVDVPRSDVVLPRNLQSNGRILERILLRNPNDANTLNLNTNVVGKFKTGSISHELLLGVELSQNTVDDVINLQSIGAIDIFAPRYRPETLSNVVIPLSSSKTQTNSIGFYIQDQISLQDNLILVLGGRFDIADQKFTDRLSAQQSFDRQDEAFSPRLGIVYKPVENVSVYASYTRSFKPVAGRETFLNDENTLVLGDPFEPERGTQYEVGVKADLFNQKISTTLAFFNLERTNVVEQGATDPVGSQQTGSQRSQGVELSVVGEIIPGLNVIASYAFTDAKITEDDTFEEGNLLRNVPKHAASLWTTYQIQSGNLKGLGLGLGLFYVGEREGDLNNSFTLPSYLRTDASLFYQRDGFRASLNVQNLFDVDFFQGSRDELRVIPGAPLTVFGKLSVEL